MLSMINSIFIFVSGPWGVAVVALAVFVCFILAAAHVLPPRAGIVSFICGACAWLFAYLVKTYLNSGGGGFASLANSVGLA